MNFSEAFAHLSIGIKIYRTCWPLGIYLDINGNEIYMYNDNVGVYWYPDQDAIMANDWEILL